MSADVRVESGRSGRLGAEVRPRESVRHCGPEKPKREREKGVQAEETSPFHQLPRARPSFWLLSERRRQEEPLGRGRQPTAVSAQGRGPGGGGGGSSSSSSSQVAVNVSH